MDTPCSDGDLLHIFNFAISNAWRYIIFFAWLEVDTEMNSDLTSHLIVGVWLRRKK